MSKKKINKQQQHTELDFIVPKVTVLFERKELL